MILNLSWYWHPFCSLLYQIYAYWSEIIWPAMILLTHTLCLEMRGPSSVTTVLTCIWDPMTVLLQASSVLLIVSSMGVLPTNSLLEFRWRSSKFWTSALYWLVKASSYWSVHSRIRFSQPSAVFSSKAWASEGEFCKQPRVNGSHTTGKTCPQCSERYKRAIRKRHIYSKLSKCQL